MDGPAGVPPILGELRREGDALLFAPRFPLQPGMRYRAVYRAPTGTHGADSGGPRPARPPTTARAHRSLAGRPAREPAEALPPLLGADEPRRGLSADPPARRAGGEVELPFLEIEQELWDPDARRLTLLFDPGRVKRDLLPNQEVGPPLHAGGGYTLVVDRAWPDAHGRPLAGEGRKRFRVGPPDHTPPRTSDWRVSRPRAGTRDPLVVTFPEPLDRALSSASSRSGTAPGLPFRARSRSRPARRA